MIETLWGLAAVIASVSVGYFTGFRRGHSTGWYRGYAARMHEKEDGENYQ